MGIRSVVLMPTMGSPVLVGLERITANSQPLQEESEVLAYPLEPALVSLQIPRSQPSNRAHHGWTCMLLRVDMHSMARQAHLQALICLLEERPPNCLSLVTRHSQTLVHELKDVVSTRDAERVRLCCCSLCKRSAA